jgi:hypothetical protein
VSKPLEILVRDASYPEGESPFETREQVISAIRAEISELDSPETFEDINIGHGADFPFLAVPLTALGTAVFLFLQGKKIEENIDAWIRLASRFRAAVARLRARVGQVYVDEGGISLVLVDHISRVHGPASSMESLDSLVVPFDTNSWNRRGTLASEPYSLHIRTIRVDDIIYVAGARSSCEVDFVHAYRERYGFSDWVPRAEADAAREELEQ